MNARDLALDLLHRRFGALPQLPLAHDLAGFQQEAKQRLLAMLERYGGALLADSVGLGKTHVAAAIARDCTSPGRGVVAVVPASLQRMWRRALTGMDATIVTHARLSRGTVPATGGFGIVVVDEAHAFRNPAARRYAALARLAHGRRILLLSATPINNSLWDLYWLLRLFAGNDAFAACGVPDLYACVDAAERSGRAGRLPAVLGEVAVRRTRAVIEELHDGARIAGVTLAFPRREPPRPIQYELPLALLRLVRHLVRSLHLVPWQLGAPAAALTLMRLGLLKRLESSTHALIASLRQLESALRTFADGLAAGRLLLPADHTSAGEDTLQLSLAPLLGNALPPTIDPVALGRVAQADLRLLTRVLGRVAPFHVRDPKLLCLQELLSGELRGLPVLVFTEYRATAEYLHAQLHRRFPTALIHGSGAYLGASPASRRAIVERFAPRANQARDPPRSDRVRVLIATDVLAEGLNLQDAADVISYDLPWNPMRIVQRLGRVDRLGSPHPSVRGWYFAPQQGLETLLGLELRLRRKLRRARAALGLDAPVLAARNPANAADVLRSLAAGDGTALAHAERVDADLFTADERLRTEYRRALAPDAMAGLPLATDAGQPSACKRRSRKAPATAGLPCVRIAFAAAPRSAVACVVFQLEGVQRAVFVARRGAFEDDVAFSQLLRLALASEDAPVTAARTTDLTLIRRALYPLRPMGRMPRPDRAVRPLRDRLLGLLQDSPGGATPEECARVQHVLERLAGGLLPHQRAALGRLARSPQDGGLGGVLAGVECALDAASPRPVARPRRGPRRPLPIAIFHLSHPLTDHPDLAILEGSEVDPA